MWLTLVYKVTTLRYCSFRSNKIFETSRVGESPKLSSRLFLSLSLTHSLTLSLSLSLSLSVSLPLLFSSSSYPLSQVLKTKTKRSIFDSRNESQDCPPWQYDSQATMQDISCNCTRKRHKKSQAAMFEYCWYHYFHEQVQPGAMKLVL